MTIQDLDNENDKKSSPVSDCNLNAQFKKCLNNQTDVYPSTSVCAVFARWRWWGHLRISVLTV